MTITITKCRQSCPFFSFTMDGMECGHPYWDDKGTFDNMIITQENTANGKIPEKCPLRLEPLTIKYQL